MEGDALAWSCRASNGDVANTQRNAAVTIIFAMADEYLVAGPVRDGKRPLLPGGHVGAAIGRLRNSSSRVNTRLAEGAQSQGRVKAFATRPEASGPQSMPRSRAARRPCDDSSPLYGAENQPGLGRTPDKNRPSQAHKIKGRISPIRPFPKVWVQDRWTRFPLVGC